METKHYISKETFDSLKSSKETLYPWLIETIEGFELGVLKIEDITNCKIFSNHTEIVLAEVDEETTVNKTIVLYFWF